MISSLIWYLVSETAKRVLSLCARRAARRIDARVARVFKARRQRAAQPAALVDGTNQVGEQRV